MVVGVTRTTVGFGATMRTALPLSSSNAILLGNFMDSTLLTLGREVIAPNDLFVSKPVIVGVLGVPVSNIGVEAFEEGSLVALLWGVDANGVPGGVITANTGISGAVATNCFITFVFSSSSLGITVDMAALVGAGIAGSCCLTITGKVDGGACGGLLLGDFCIGIFGTGALKRTMYLNPFKMYTANLY